MMMLGLQRLHCGRVRRALWDYVVERLSEGPLEDVERHLRRCVTCRREAELLRRAQGLLASCRSSPMPPPRSGWRDLRARLEVEGQTVLTASDEPVHISRTPAGYRQRLAAPPRTSWLTTLAASTACASLMMLVALGYHSLTVPIRSAGGTSERSVLHGTHGEPRPQTVAAADADVAMSHTLDGHQSLPVPDGGLADSDWVRLHTRAGRPERASMESDTGQVKGVAYVPHRSEQPHRLVHRSDDSPRNSRVAEHRIADSANHNRRQHTSDVPELAANKLHFRPYKIRPEDALPQDRGDEDRYAIDGVAPGGSAGTGGIYIMPSVRPVQYDGNSPY